jgi:hypothetical protein
MTDIPNNVATQSPVGNSMPSGDWNKETQYAPSPQPMDLPMAPRSQGELTTLEQNRSRAQEIRNEASQAMEAKRADQVVNQSVNQEHAQQPVPPVGSVHTQVINNCPGDCISQGLSQGSHGHCQWQSPTLAQGTPQEAAHAHQTEAREIRESQAPTIEHRANEPQHEHVARMQAASAELRRAADFQAADRRAQAASDSLGQQIQQAEHTKRMNAGIRESQLAAKLKEQGHGPIHQPQLAEHGRLDHIANMPIGPEQAPSPAPQPQKNPVPAQLEQPKGTPIDLQPATFRDRETVPAPAPQRRYNNGISSQDHAPQPVPAESLRDKIHHAVRGNEYNRIIREYPENHAHAAPQQEVDSKKRGSHGLFQQHANETRLAPTPVSQAASENEARVYQAMLARHQQPAPVAAQQAPSQAPIAAAAPQHAPSSEQQTTPHPYTQAAPRPVEQPGWLRRQAQQHFPATESAATSVYRKTKEWTRSQGQQAVSDATRAQTAHSPQATPETARKARPGDIQVNQATAQQVRHQANQAMSPQPANGSSHHTSMLSVHPSAGRVDIKPKGHIVDLRTLHHVDQAADDCRVQNCTRCCQQANKKRGNWDGKSGIKPRAPRYTDEYEQLESGRFLQATSDFREGRDPTKNRGQGQSMGHGR